MIFNTMWLKWGDCKFIKCYIQRIDVNMWIKQLLPNGSKWFKIDKVITKLILVRMKQMLLNA